LRRSGTAAVDYPRRPMSQERVRAFAIGYGRRPPTTGDSLASQGWCADNVPTDYSCCRSRNVPEHLLVLFSLGRLPVMGELDVAK
jgi:hypothetical protein